MNFEFKFGVNDRAFTACCFTAAALLLFYGAAKIKGFID